MTKQLMTALYPNRQKLGVPFENAQRKDAVIFDGQRYTGIKEGYISSREGYQTVNAEEYEKRQKDIALTIQLENMETLRKIEKNVRYLFVMALLGILGSAVAIIFTAVKLASISL